RALVDSAGPAAGRLGAADRLAARNLRAPASRAAFAGRLSLGSGADRRAVGAVSLGTAGRAHAGSVDGVLSAATGHGADRTPVLWRAPAPFAATGGGVRHAWRAA